MQFMGKNAGYLHIKCSFEPGEEDLEELPPFSGKVIVKGSDGEPFKLGSEDWETPPRTPPKILAGVDLEPHHEPGHGPVGWEKTKNKRTYSGIARCADGAVPGKVINGICYYVDASGDSGGQVRSTVDFDLIDIWHLCTTAQSRPLGYKFTT